MKIPIHGAYIVLPPSQFYRLTRLEACSDDIKWAVLVPASNADALREAVAFLQRITGLENPENTFAGTVTLDDQPYRNFLIE